MSSITQEVERISRLKGRACSACVHVTVCKFYMTVAEMLKQLCEIKGIKPPFEAEEIGIVCKDFMPVVATEMLRRAEG